MSLKVRFGLFKRQTCPLLHIFHYLGFTQKQEQLDFTQTHKLTVFCCVTPFVFLKSPPEAEFWHHFPCYFARRPLPRCTLCPSFLAQLQIQLESSQMQALLSSFLFPSTTCTPQCVLILGLQTAD